MIRDVFSMPNELPGFAKKSSCPVFGEKKRTPMPSIRYGESPFKNGKRASQCFRDKEIILKVLGR